MGESAPVRPVEPPLEVFDSQCDDKGRVRLPSKLEAFVRSLPGDQFFVTTLDGDTGRIYPIEIWREIEKTLMSDTDDPDAAMNFLYWARYWGSVVPLDSAGRVLISTNLRRKLGIEDQKVHLMYLNGGVDLYSTAVSDKRLKAAEESLPRILPALRKKGLR